MTDSKKRKILLEAANNSHYIKLSIDEKRLIHWFLYEQETLKYVSIEENLFHYALGRILEINIYYAEDMFGHATSVETECRFIQRDVLGEVVITDINEIRQLLENEPPVKNNHGIQIIFNYINIDVPNYIEKTLGEQKVECIQVQSVDPIIIDDIEIHPEHYPTYNNANEQDLEMKSVNPYKRNHRKKQVEPNHEKKIELQPNFFEILEKINMDNAWQIEIDRALENQQFDYCYALSEARNKMKSKTVNVQLKTFNKIQQSY